MPSAFGTVTLAVKVCDCPGSRLKVKVEGLVVNPTEDVSSSLTLKTPAGTG